MKCMCAQTRPRFILSSERVLGGMEFEPMLTPRKKSPLPENVPRGGSNPRRCGPRAQALPTELFRPPTPAVTTGTVRACDKMALFDLPLHHWSLHGHWCVIITLISARSSARSEDAGYEMKDWTAHRAQGPGGEIFFSFIRRKLQSPR